VTVRIPLLSSLILASMLAMTAAYAEPDANNQSSREHYERGKQLVADHQFAAAYGEFNAGFEASPRPLFLFNMAECERALGNFEHARDLYERFVAASPDDPLAAKARARLAELPAVAPVATPVAPSPPATHPAPVVPPPPNTTPLVAPAPSHRVAFWFGASAIATGGGALALELFAESTYSKAKSAANQSSQQTSLWHSANDLRYAAEGAAVVGVACAATSVWLYLRGEHREPDPRAHSARIVPTLNGVALLGAF
jgi:tetratricopeptide (TPR) repeat protein